MNKFSRGNRVQRTAIALAITAAFSTTAFAAEEANVTEDVKITSDVEVIEVYGIAGSLAESARQKRFDNRIVDAIVAEDIGKLPDNNIAEALQRITGVSISSNFGVGESVTIRGISQNRVELNGRSTSGTGRGGIGLDDFPASFLKTVEVVKSPTPEMIEGALGGTVNMKTVRPLELDEALFAFTADAEYSDKTENTAPKFTIAAGNNWDLGDSGTVGANFVFSYLDREIRQDEFQTKMNHMSTDDIDGFDEVGNGPNESVQVRTENTVRLQTEERERTAYGASFQWAPASGDGNFYLDLSGTKLTGGELAYDFLDVGGTVTANENTYQSSTGQLMNYDLVGAFVIPKTESDFAENDSYSHAFGGEWQLTDKLNVTGEIAITGSEDNAVNSQFNLRPVDRDAYEAAYALDNTASPGSYMNTFTATVGNQDDKISSVVYSDPTALTSADTMAIREMYFDTIDQENDEVAVRFDLEYSEPMGIDWISSVKAGIRVTDREYKYRTAELQNNNGSTFKDAYKKAMVLDADGNATDVVATPTFIDDFDGISLITHDNLFDQAGYAGPNQLTAGANVLDAKILRDNPALVYSQLQEALAGTTYSTTGSIYDNLYDQDEEWKKIEEKTRALYVQFHLDFDDITAVVGGRYVETDLDSSIIQDGDMLTGTHDYNDFLPSLNVTYNMYDDTIVRFAAAKVMRRAAFGDLSPAYEIGNTLLNGTQGSYELDPYRVTQYDLSIEHYFGEGGLISAAIFYKDVKSFTVPTTSCIADSATIVEQQVADEWANACILDQAGVSQSTVNTASLSDYPVAGEGQAYVEGLQAAGRTGIIVSSETNGGSGEVKGLELAFQQQFDFLPGAWSGMGVATNYTYADSEQPNGLPLENISEHSANFQLYWEHAGFQTRIAYNWRDSYLDEEDEGKRLWSGGEQGLGNDSSRVDPTSGNSYREARGQLDYSVSYDVNDNLTVVGNAVNLTGEPLVFSSAQGHNWKINEADRRFTVGVRAKF